MVEAKQGTGTHEEKKKPKDANNATIAINAKANSAAINAMKRAITRKNAINKISTTAKKMNGARAKRKRMKSAISQSKKTKEKKNQKKIGASIIGMN